MRRPTPTIAIGALMFFLGAVVTAGAAKLITSADIKNGTIQLVDIANKARKSLAGADGADGVSGLAILAGTVSADNGWTSPRGGGNDGSEAGAQVPVPADSSSTAKSLIVTAAAPPGAGRSVTATLRLNGADTAQSCTIEGDSTTSCTPPGGRPSSSPAVRRSPSTASSPAAR